MERRYHVNITVLSSIELVAFFILFPKLKTTLKGRRFKTIEEIQENALRELRFIAASAFREAFQQWKKKSKHSIRLTKPNYMSNNLIKRIGLIRQRKSKKCQAVQTFTSAICIPSPSSFLFRLVYVVCKVSNYLRQLLLQALKTRDENIPS